MGLLEYTLIVLLLAQIVFTFQVWKNYRYAMRKYRLKRDTYRPQCALIVPCKGLDETFDANIRSFYSQDYQGYHLFFVVQETSDPAFDRLHELKSRLETDSLAKSVKIIVAGHTSLCSQKLHNLLYVCRRVPEDTEALVFADSDACAGSDWLAHIVHPLSQNKSGAAGGYRCFVPQKNNSATVALSAVNAKVCQLLGNMQFNLAWGGSMAILKRDFFKWGLDRIWEKALSDDLTLSKAVRQNGHKMVFVPACMIASYETTTWPQLWEFARRQFVITRVYAPLMWAFGLFSAVFSVIGLWGGLTLALWAVRVGHPSAGLCISVPVVFFASQLFRAVLRQHLIVKLLPKEKNTLTAARWVDITLFWLLSILLLGIILTSAIGKTITWRGIKYRLNSPTDIEIIS